MTPRILVVDDEENVLVTIEAILRMDGYAVETQQAGDAAIEQIKNNDYDVVLTDLRLGEASGQDILQAVRRHSPQTVAIMLTGYASLESAIGALREGAYDYLVKPSDPEELRATVRRAVERRDLMKRLVQLQELDQLKSQFLSIASHELRTPITAVSGFAQLALRTVQQRLDGVGTPTTELDLHRLARQLTVIQEQSAKLGRLVRELLDVSRIQQGRLEFERSPIDLAEVTRTVVEQHQMTSPRFAYQIDIDGPLMVLGDRDHLEQVIANLIDNAVKYSAEGGPIRVRARSDGREAHLLIEDEGIGISAEQLAQVFDLFFRTREAEARRTPGLGLGLYITRSIVERHGGRVWAESEPAKGTSVHVVLPLHHLTKRSVPPEPARAEATA